MAGRRQPAREDVQAHDRLTVVEHPVCDDLLATIRDRRCDAGEFGRAARLLAMFLLWEASRTLQALDADVPGFDGSQVRVRTLAQAPAGISILRAGEVFTGPFRQVFPDAPLFHLGIRRDEATLEHHVYSDTLSDVPGDRRFMVLDPMLATGGSVTVALERARNAGAGSIDVIALVSAPLGVQTVLEADSEARIITAALDERLNEQGYILPGLGDAGDRFFGTMG